MTLTWTQFDYRIPSPFDATTILRAIDVVRSDRQARAYMIPPQPVRGVADLTQKLRDLQCWTGWTNRTLAQVIGSSHPTVNKALDGETTALSRSETQRRRLSDAHDVVARIYLLADRDSARAAEALAAPDRDGVTAIEYLNQDQISQAYLAAMRALRPSRPTRLLVGSHPIDPRQASVAVLDED